jgi:hypothetical protein
MKKFSIKAILLPLLGLLGLSRLSAQEIPQLKPITTNINLEGNTGKYITITKIPKPWIASRKLVVKKFMESIPEYAKVNGLLTKYFALTEKHTHFGGIYLWQNEAAARNWFNLKWFERVREKYKSPGEVSYYSVTGIRNLQTITETQGKYCSVLSLGKAELAYPAKGLLRIIYITDEKGIHGHISLWASEKEARDYFLTDLAADEFFDTPVLLNNQ